MHGTIADKSDDDEDGTEPRGNHQRIGECPGRASGLQPQKFFTTLQCIEDKASVMDDQTVPEGAKHRMHWQVASHWQCSLRRCNELHCPKRCQTG